MLEDEIRCPNFGGKALYTILPAPSSVHSGKTSLCEQNRRLGEHDFPILCAMVLVNQSIKTNKKALLKSL